MNQNHKIYNKLSKNEKSLAVLIDPDKFTTTDQLSHLIRIAVECKVAYFFVGGSLITRHTEPKIVNLIKEYCQIPVVLFPGSNMYIEKNADALLFLSLISGRNPDLLIGQHVTVAPLLYQSALEVIPTGYMLIDGGKPTSVSYISNTTPIPSDKAEIAVSTALAGEMLGLKVIYMDAGSGATLPVSLPMITKVRSAIQLPLIVGGGMDTKDKVLSALGAGADTAVIGNALEKDPNLLIEVSEGIQELQYSK